MIKFQNLPHGPAECAVIASTPAGNYINAKGDRLQIIAIDCYICATDYEAALPEYKIVLISEMGVPENTDLKGKFISIEMVAR